MNRAVFSALFFMGEIRELRRRVASVLRDAQDRGDVYAASNCRLGLSNAAWLGADDPEGARRAADDALAEWERLGVPHALLWGAVTHVQIDLYLGQAAAALQRDRPAHWRAFARSILPRAQPERVGASFWRARAALGTAAHPACDQAERRRLLASVESDAARVAKERTAWCDPIAYLLTAGVAAVRRAPEDASTLLDAAVRGFDRADMVLFAAVARRRRARFVGGGDGAALISASDATMARQQIVAPERWAAMLAPGFPG